MWIIFKVFIDFVTILLLFYAWLWGFKDHSSPPRDQICTPCIGGWSLNYWMAWEVPRTRSFQFRIPKACHGICYCWVLYMCLSAHMLSRFSCVWLFVTPWTVACQAPLSMGFSRQEYWRGLPGPPPGIFLTQGLNSHLLNFPHWQVGSLPLVPSGKPSICVCCC